MDIPIKKQIYNDINEAIIYGKLSPGEKLDSTRKLSNHLGINRNIIIEVYEQLIDEGYLVSKVGKGTFVNEKINFSIKKDKHTIIEPKVEDKKNDCIKFQSQIPDLSLFPDKQWMKMMKSAYLNFSHDEYPLCIELAHYLSKSKGINCLPEQIFLTSGTTDALSFIALLLRHDYNQVMTESPGMSLIPDIYKRYGYTIQPIKTDLKGVCVEDIRIPNKSLVFVSPVHQFPLGGTLPLQRKIKLTDLASKSNSFIIEYDDSSELCYVGAQVNSLYQLNPKNVIHLCTFNHTIAKEIPLGYMILPKSLVEKARKLRQKLNYHTTIEQLTLYHFLKSGEYGKHINRIKKSYKQKMKTLIKSLQFEFNDHIEIHGHTTGMHVMIKFKDVRDVRFIKSPAFKQRLKQNKVWVNFIEEYLINKNEINSYHDMLILGFGALNLKEIKEGVKRLANCFKFRSH